MSRPIPQAIADALDVALGAREDVDGATAQKVTTTGELATAQARDAQADEELAAKSAVLNAARTKLDALVDEFLRPGGTLPPSLQAERPGGSPPGANANPFAKQPAAAS